MSVIQIQIQMSHLGFWLEYVDVNKNTTICFYQKRASQIEIIKNHILKSYYHNNPEWIDIVNENLSIIHNEYFRSLVYDLIVSRKKWKIVIPIISKIFNYTYNRNNIELKLQCFQNNLVYNSSSIIYNNEIGINQKIYNDKIKKKIIISLPVVMLDIIYDYLSTDLKYYETINIINYTAEHSNYLVRKRIIELN